MKNVIVQKYYLCRDLVYQQQGEKPYAYDANDGHKLQPLPSSFDKNRLLLQCLFVATCIFNWTIRVYYITYKCISFN